MSDVSCIAVKHQHGKVLLGTFVWRANVECGQLLAIWGRDHKLFEVCDAELRGSRDRCAGFIRDMGRINKSSVHMSDRFWGGGEISFTSA